MAQFEPHQSEIRSVNASLVYIAAEKSNGLFKPEKYLSEHPVSFPFLLDEDRNVARAYGVYQRFGLDAFHIARPATFVADRQGVIHFIHVGSSQTDRVPVAQIMRQFEKL